VEEVVSRVDARIGKVLVNEGQLVKQGEVLIELNEKDLRRKITDARIKHLKAKSNLEELETWGRSPAYLTAKYNLESAQTDYEEGLRTYEENKKLLEQKAISKNDLHQSERELNRRRIALEKAKLTLNEEKEKGSPTAIEEARAELEVTESELEEKNTALEFKLIIAPCDGVVSFERGGVPETDATILALTENRAVSAGEFLLKIENHSDFIIRARVNEYDAVRLTQGQPCTIRIPAIPGVVLPGKIESVYPVIDKGSRTFFEIKCQVAPSEHRLRSGLTANIQIVLDQKMNALIIPLSALVSTGGGNQVFIVGEDGEPSLLPVQVGIKSMHQVEIVSGLEQGQSIVCQIPADLLKLAQGNSAKSLGGGINYLPGMPPSTMQRHIPGAGKIPGMGNAAPGLPQMPLNAPGVDKIPGVGNAAPTSPQAPGIPPNDSRGKRAP
jgi:multidrug efflux pump subunit AcrA (membrane-fusion protein)